ncbi:MAG: hypothetical protein GY899_18770 [Verrucomicrobiaceae bacterium]|nr:hypothetical protein [Verrucomicrobiaceae bacterium]
MSAENHIPGLRHLITLVIIIHLLSLPLPMFNGSNIPGNQLSGARAMIEIPLVMAIELLILLSVAIYILVIFSRRKPRTETTIGVFNGSLVLSLTAPALLMPLAGSRASQGNWLFSNLLEKETPSTVTIAFMSPLWGFWLWLVSISLIGLTIHLATITRWKRYSRQ